MANTYTGAKFEPRELNEADSPTSILLVACSMFVENQFPDLALDDIGTAFEMAAAQKFSISIETYYGKFDVSILGKILNAYKKFRSNVISEYNKVELLESSRKEDANKDEKNELVRAEVIKEYEHLKKVYEIDFEINEKYIKPFWAEILINAGLIAFSKEEKQDIWKESKELTAQELASSVIADNPINHLSKQDCRRLLAQYRDYKDDQTGTKVFPTRMQELSVEKYKTLIVKKSIINQQ